MKDNEEAVDFINDEEPIDSIDIWAHIEVPGENKFVLVGVPSKAKKPESIRVSSNMDFLIHTAYLKRAPYYSSLKIYNHKKEAIWPLEPAHDKPY